MGDHVRYIEDEHGQVEDVLYFCSAGCWADSFAEDRIGIVPHGTQPHEAGASPCASSEPGAEADIYCAECGVLMASPDKEPPVVVNLIERPPIVGGVAEPRLELHEEARLIGRDHGRNAASWIVNGNDDPEVARKVLAMMREGDPVADIYLPVRPNLSGEWAGDPTPRSLYEDITGGDAADATDEDLEAIGDGYEAGVDETFETSCEAELIRFVGDDNHEED